MKTEKFSVLSVDNERYSKSVKTKEKIELTNRFGK